MRLVSSSAAVRILVERLDVGGEIGHGCEFAISIWFEARER